MNYYYVYGYYCFGMQNVPNIFPIRESALFAYVFNGFTSSSRKRVQARFCSSIWYQFKITIIFAILSPLFFVPEQCRPL